jgi:hypothetical protein
MLHAALLLLVMLEVANADLVFTISLKRSTHNRQLSTSCQADYAIFAPPKPDIAQWLVLARPPRRTNAAHVWVKTHCIHFQSLLKGTKVASYHPVWLNGLKYRALGARVSVEKEVSGSGRVGIGDGVEVLVYAGRKNEARAKYQKASTLDLSVANNAVLIRIIHD